mmetsp:Transcript_34345/g.80383  ORF Transcript_34345/g.80383 Transcript_34345/m.80383 type:complete len:196 (+) Transcript_34345:93-680(+)
MAYLTRLKPGLAASARHIIWGIVEDIDPLLRRSSASSSEDSIEAEDVRHPDMQCDPLPLGGCMDAAERSMWLEEALQDVVFMPESPGSEGVSGPSEWSHQGNSLVPDREPSWSEGAILHGTGHCRPCCHYWKPGSCRLGRDCDFCHLCTARDVRLKRSERFFAAKARRRERRAQVANCTNGGAHSFDAESHPPAS